MKRSRVESRITKNFEVERETIIAFLRVFLILIFIISLILLFIHFNKNNITYIEADERGKLDYKVGIEQNEYFSENFLDMDKQYISNLINYIDAEFKYDFNIKEDIKYKYKYKITENVNVIEEGTNKVIYTSSNDLIQEKTGESNEKLSLNECVKIDYKKHNDLINKFVNVYKLSNIVSKLTVKMDVEIIGNNEEFDKQISSMVLDIPLTANTVSMDVKYDFDNNGEPKVIPLTYNENNSKIYVIIAIILLMIDISATIGLIIYMKMTETDEDKYNIQLKKIMNAYGSYISKVEDEFKMADYQVLKVEKFVDLLEIRDTMQIPIIMVENKENNSSYFMIPTMNNILYFFALGVTQLALPNNETKEKQEENGEDKGKYENEEKKETKDESEINEDNNKVEDKEVQNV